MDDVQAVAETPTRIRTRSAILSAAIRVLSQNPAAALSEVADTAGVARSTLHRYFPERADLLEAMGRFAREQLNAARQRARIDEGSAAEALVRICHEYFDQWDTITWIYMESVTQESEPCDPEDSLDAGLTQLITRGYDEGTIDPAMSSAWLQQLLWALLYSAQEYVRQGQSRHDALSFAVASLRKLMSPALAISEQHLG